MASYLFYDLETSGLSKPFDQIQQFAGKRLDADFNELESSFLEVKVGPDVIPSPYAIVTHQVNLDDDHGRMTEWQAIQTIHAMFNQPQTISIGYNTLGFDDEFLRFAFYRNLLSPYTHQYANQCQRWDVFPIAVFYYLYENSALSWPQIDGKPTLKLEHIVTENGWFQGRAHHAMNDVDATIQLAQHLQKANPEMWRYLKGYFDKNTDRDRIFALPKAFKDHNDFQFGLMVHARLGVASGYQAMVLALGCHTHFKNQTVWLRLDKMLLEDIEFTSLDQKGLIMRKKFGEPGFLLPPSEHFSRHISLERMRVVEENLRIIAKNYPAVEQVQREARAFMFERVEAVDVDAGLYDLGFLSVDEQQFCREFHVAPLPMKEKMMMALKNKHLAEQCRRILWRQDLLELNSPEAKAVQEYHKKIYQTKQPTEIWDYKGERKRGVFEVLKELSTIDRSALDANQVLVLAAFEKWLNQRRSEVSE